MKHRPRVVFGLFLACLVAVGLPLACQESPAPTPEPTVPAPSPGPHNSQGALTGVTIAVPNTVGSASTWVPSTLTHVASLGLIGSATNADSVILLGTNDNTRVVTTANSLASFFGQQNLQNIGTQGSALGAFTYFAVIRTAGTTTGLNFVLVGDDGGTSSGTGTGSSGSGGIVQIASADGGVIDPATAENQALQLVKETTIANETTRIASGMVFPGSATAGSFAFFASGVDGNGFSRPLATDSNGDLIVNQGTAALIGSAWPTYLTDGTHGPVAVRGANSAALPADPSAVIAFSPNSPLPVGANTIGGVLQSGPWTVTQSGTWNVGGLGTAGTPTGGVFTMQGSASGTPVPVSGTVTSTIPAVGLTNNAAPTSSILGGCSDGSSVLRAVSCQSGGSLNVSITGQSSALTAVVTGTVTANEQLDIAGNGFSLTGTAQTIDLTTAQTDAITFSILGTWSGTILFQASVDNSTFFGIRCRFADVNNQDSSKIGTTVNGLVTCPAGSFSNVQLLSSGSWTGTATVKLIKSALANVVRNIAGSEGTIGAIAPLNAELMGVKDGSGNIQPITLGPAPGASAIPVVPPPATRRDFGATLASGSTLLVAGAGSLMGSSASTAAVAGAVFCFYDGDPAAAGVQIAVYSVNTGLYGGLQNVPTPGIPYANGLYVRAASAVATCASLGASLSLGFGNAVTVP